MQMNRLGRGLLNSRARAAAQRRYVVPIMERLGGDLQHCRVLEIGCGGGSGAALLVELLRAEHVTAIDLDPAMVRRAAGRLRDRAGVRVGDMTHLAAEAHYYEAVVDLGAMHIEADWRLALTEVRRVLTPSGRFFFEEIVRPSRQTLSTLATGRRPPSDFSRKALLGELASLGFLTVGPHDVGVPACTGVIGDLIGAARAPAAGTCGRSCPSGDP